MDYNNILKEIDEQKKKAHLSAQFFRYSGLIHAIEFFSQKLNFDQIIDSGFDFFNELLTIEKSAVFVPKDGSYILKKSKGCNSDICSIKYNSDFDNIAILHGTLMSGHSLLEKFFEKDILASYKVSTIIPLIIDNHLYGFIFISDKEINDMSSDDYIIAECLMKLINNALEDYKHYGELQEANKNLDEKIFNLFAINQSSKALLSELDLNTLYNLSIDVFSELTQNTITGFILYDGRSESYVLKASKNIYSKKMNYNICLTANKDICLNTNKVLINTSLKEDLEYFNSLFIEGLEGISDLAPQYIVLLIKNNTLLGFVTLSQSVTGQQYQSSMFELIESLASSTYVAISNAQLFQQVNEQKKIIQNKLDKLISLNNLIKNINSSTNIENLLDITMKTLDVSFHVNKAIICLYDTATEKFIIENTLNIKTRKKVIKTNNYWEKIMLGNSIYESNDQGISNYIDETLLSDIGPVPGIMIVPIYLDRADTEVLGCIMIFEHRNALHYNGENVLTFETIAGQVSPILDSLQKIEEQKKLLVPNYIEIFKSDLKSEIDEAIDFTTELTILQISDSKPFKFENKSLIDKLSVLYEKIYPLSYNNIFIIVKDNCKSIDMKVASMGDLKNTLIRKFEFRKDFKNYQDFFKLFK